MIKLNCRYSNCAMNFSHERQRENHESMMHKTLLDDTSKIFLNRILQINSQESLNKPLLKTFLGTYSYNQASKLFDENSNEGLAVRDKLKQIVQIMYETNPEYNMNDFLHLDFKING